MQSNEAKEKQDIKFNVLIFRFFLGKRPFLTELWLINAFSRSFIRTIRNCAWTFADHLPDERELLSSIRKVKYNELIINCVKFYFTSRKTTTKQIILSWTI